MNHTVRARTLHQRATGVGSCGRTKCPCGGVTDWGPSGEQNAASAAAIRVRQQLLMNGSSATVALDMTSSGIDGGECK